ncbi:SusD/RagB family nutrient-binding outer membrane lipoprotein [Mangrovibacterium diazotrophicum]|uniref:SusD-like starch-binding protein associating with outer membrane n=1 Tax=Mangrovibacterium diazotrophicum TaxID=1261403 RepID=A0A419W985_9BACT|nr:SusD/RagB family nutrient-binding outer membrane lipoprotein [Mangrovibacterium diazotrophicum]RKD92023.1 SusD-like starch-binding protein associating with outer membrane [Mangrovibacterium diazotrophicum]
MKFKIALIATVVALGLGSCTSDFVDINKDPNAILGDQISARYFITGTQVQLFAPNRYPYWRAQLIHADRYAGMFCFGFSSSWWSDELGYSYNSGYTDAAWDYYEGYNSTINTYLQLTEPGGDLDNSLTYATALIMKSMFYQKFTDTFGEVPYSESGDLEILQPKFDTQMEIYEGIIADLNTAISLIGDESVTGVGTEDLGSNDLFYGGDLQKWKKLANTLKLKVALRAYGASGATFVDSAISEALASDLLMDSSDDCLLPKDAEIDQWSSACYGDVWYNFGDGSDWTVSQEVIDYLQKYDDPRLSKYAQPAVGGDAITIPKPGSDTDEMYQKRKNFILAALDDAGAVYTETTDADGASVISMAASTYYVGQPVRLNSNMVNYARYPLFSKPAEYIIQQKNQGEDIAPEIVLTTAEAYFMKAQAILMGYGSGDANTIYREGLRYAMLLWGVTEDEVDDFLTNSSMATLDGSNDMEKVIVQRWLANYTEGFEAWAIVRKNGYPASLAAGVSDGDIYGLGTLNGAYPQRMRYGSSPYSTNADNLQEAIASQGADVQATQLWWAK